MSNGIDVVVEATRKLLSPAAPQVISLIGAPEAQIEPLRRAIEVDPVLTVRIIDYANHSFYARQVPVASLQRALVRLGWETSCDLLLRLVVETATESSAGALARPMWEHSLRVAVLTRLLAKDARVVDPALAFTGGLVHGLGQLGLLALHRDAYATLWRNAPSGPHLARAERQAYGFDHARVGAGVLAQLSVPEELPGAITRMYRASLAQRSWAGRPDLPLAALLQLSQTLLYGEGDRLDDAEWIASSRLVRRFALRDDQIATLGVRFQDAYDRQLGAAEAA